jgi:hypothetical protein
MSIVPRSSLLIVAAFVAWGLWLGEVCWVKGWASLAWLDSFNWSSLPICAVIAVSCSYFVTPGAGWRERMKFILFGSALATGAFVAGRWAIFEFFSSWLFVNYVAIAELAAAGLTVSVGLTAATSRWLAPLHIWTAGAVIVALVLVLPLSIITVIEFPALNGGTSEIDATKMGYPVLWTALLVPLALRLGRKHRRSKASELATS